MESLEYIDRYFKGEFLPGETKQFENRVANDPAFAEEVAFYCSAMHVARDQAIADKKRRFRELYQQSKQVGQTVPVKRMWFYAAAAAVVTGLLVGWFLFVQAPDHQQMADRYIQRNFKTLGINLGTDHDSLRSALRLYNSGRPEEALQQLEGIIRSDTTNFTAIKYAGIIYLQFGQFDKALEHFRQLDSFTGLYANPGKFYQALTLMKRNHPGDVKLAKKLLHQVVESDQEGKEIALEWLKLL